MTRYLLIKEEPCPECDGTGKIIWGMSYGKAELFCTVCDGTGKERTEIDLRQALVELGQAGDGK